MNELKLFSFRRIIISSLVLGIITLMLLNSAIGNPSNNNSDDTGTLSDTTTTTESTTTSNANTNTDTNIAEIVTVAETIAESDNFAQDVAQESVEEAGRFAPTKIFSLSSDDNDLTDFLSIGIFLALISSVFFGIFFLFYSYIYNNKDLTLYLNHSLNQSGFQHKISQIGKKWMILTDTGKQFNMKLIGTRKLRMEITLPMEETVDPREFGFRSSKPNAITFCNLELLPMRLQVVQLYFSDLG